MVDAEPGIVGSKMADVSIMGYKMADNKSPRPQPEPGHLGLPKMEATQPYGGVPPPPGSLGNPLRLSPGDVLEVTVAEAEQLWWQCPQCPSQVPTMSP
ncbi:hypothetical protein AV530_007062 [Patagioenas fasciata monilis]|uniref:SH3 domain-containing protein n=1 Tax=Patagioenas fasciata monilis TaxID=372326 RepID=A0A1V4KKC2_PATFA|nr:hypothetical protein AV530_007062 [Patagioenas fasciata monilis]